MQNIQDQQGLQPLPVVSLTRQGPRSETSSELCSLSVAAERATIMLGCYRKGEVADEEIFTRGVITVLRGYPEDIVRAATDPAKGLPSRSQWLPTIAEIRSACDALYAPVLKKRELEYRRLMQQRERLMAPEVSAEERARAVEYWREIRAELGPGEREDHEKEQQEAKARLAIAEAQAGKGLRLSSEALAKMVVSVESEAA